MLISVNFSFYSVTGFFDNPVVFTYWATMVIQLCPYDWTGAKESDKCNVNHLVYLSIHLIKAQLNKRNPDCWMWCFTKTQAHMLIIDLSQMLA